MKTLTIRPPSQHAGGAILLTLGLAAVAVLATRSHLAGGDTRETLAIVGFGAEACALLARAVREDPGGMASQHLTALFYDEKAALAQGTGQAASPLDDGNGPALADANSNIALVSRDCA